MRNLLLVAALWMALLSDASANVDSRTQKLDEIREQQTVLQAEVRGGRGAFKDMAAPDRDSLLAKQDRVLTLLQGRQSIDQLSEAERLELFNTLEEIKGVVTNAEDSRMVCQRVKVVGSNLPQRVCMTVAQRREQQEQARARMLKANVCADASCIAN